MLVPHVRQAAHGDSIAHGREDAGEDAEDDDAGEGVGGADDDAADCVEECGDNVGGFAAEGFGDGGEEETAEGLAEEVAGMEG